jgi:creatinine amidohydrolase
MISMARCMITSAAILSALTLSGVVSAASQNDSRSMGGGDCETNRYNCADTPNPLKPADTVWLAEMTWMDVRDALVAGKRTIIIPTGGVEPNGPWVVLGKHHFILRTMCEVIANKLGDALCAPVVDFVNEGDLQTMSGHLDTPGTISVSDATYEALISDIVRSLKAGGFEHIVLISDNGGSNQSGQKAVAEKLNKEWGKPVVHYIPQYYQSWENADNVFLRKGLTKKGVRDSLHDDPSVTTLLMLDNPKWVRWEERVAADELTIDGVSIADKEQAIEWGHELAEARAKPTVKAIREAIASGSMPKK